VYRVFRVLNFKAFLYYFIDSSDTFDPSSVTWNPEARTCMQLWSMRHVRSIVFLQSQSSVSSKRVRGPRDVKCCEKYWDVRRSQYFCNLFSVNRGKPADITTYGCVMPSFEGGKTPWMFWSESRETNALARTFSKNNIEYKSPVFQWPFLVL